MWGNEFLVEKKRHDNKWYNEYWVYAVLEDAGSETKWHNAIKQTELKWTVFFSLHSQLQPLSWNGTNRYLNSGEAINWNSNWKVNEASSVVRQCDSVLVRLISTVCVQLRVLSSIAVARTVARRLRKNVKGNNNRKAIFSSNFIGPHRMTWLACLASSTTSGNILMKLWRHFPGVPPNYSTKWIYWMNNNLPKMAASE